eukprot:4247355-Prymnesium_polylepis.1
MRARRVCCRSVGHRPRPASVAPTSPGGASRAARPRPHARASRRATRSARAAARCAPVTSASAGWP